MTLDTHIIPTAEPFFFPGAPGQPGCLLIHGFTGTPKEMRWMGEYLAKQGFTVLGVRLAGHATRPDDMLRSNYEDWMTSVEDAYHVLRGSTARVYLVGLSMGGALALLMSTRLDVKGLVAISTPIALRKDYPLWWIRLLAVFRHYLPKSNDAPGTGWHDLDAWKDHISYPQNPMRSVGQLKELLTRMRAALPRIRVPALLIHSHDDTYVRPESMNRIHAAVGTAHKQMLWIKGSGHVATRDAAREQVFEAVSDFIQEVESQG